MADEYTFYLPRIETRASSTGKTKEYIIKGYASSAENAYPHFTETSSSGKPIRAFKEYFTTQCIKNMAKKAKTKKIFVDYGHHTVFQPNVQGIIGQIETRSGIDLSKEPLEGRNMNVKEYMAEVFQTADIPMFKLYDIQVDDTGLFVEIHANPLYREVNESHQKYFDSIWGSLEQGFINGMSVNFKPTDFTPLTSELNQINDVDFYGISLLAGASNPETSITEVAVRCSMNIERGVELCPTTRRMMLLA